MSKHTLGKIMHDDFAKPMKFSKPSLDSDEEDYDDKECFRLRERDIDGQEANTLEYDDDVKITPFNMKEELEDDGHFDGAGTFIFKKTDDARDSWLDEVNWLEVRHRQEHNPLANTAISDDADGVRLTSEEKLQLYKSILEYLKPKESVLRSLKRMGRCSDSKKSGSASQRWLQKNKQVQEATSGDPEGLLKLTEYADKLIQAGDFDIYQKTYEIISKYVAGHLEDGTTGGDADDELEALGQALDDKKDTDTQDIDVQSNGAQKNDDDEVLWHLKRSQNADATIEGPYTSDQLKRWLAEDKFKDSPSVLVKQCTKSDGPFYNITRIDFDLY